MTENRLDPITEFNDAATSEKKQNLFFRFFFGFWRFLFNSPKNTYRFIRGVFAGIVYAMVGLYRGVIWLIGETGYYLRLFKYMTIRFLRIESFLALCGAFLFFGYLLSEGKVSNQQDLLNYCYIFFSSMMILLAMNLLPKEKEDETLEILWSQPISRNRLIIIQLLTLTVWIVALCYGVSKTFNHFSAYQESSMMLILFIATTSFAVGAITVLISTFCHFSIATGLVAMLIIGVHFFWLKIIGPIQLFFNPLTPPGIKPPNDMTFNLIFNRIILIILVGFTLDYLFRRLKRTAQWFT